VTTVEDRCETRVANASNALRSTVAPRWGNAERGPVRRPSPVATGGEAVDQAQAPAAVVTTDVAELYRADGPVAPRSMQTVKLSPDGA
jgi:hypothetical protein